jgi:hypothetical protein
MILQTIIKQRKKIIIKIVNIKKEIMIVTIEEVMVEAEVEEITIKIIIEIEIINSKVTDIENLTKDVIANHIKAIGNLIKVIENHIKEATEDSITGIIIETIRIIKMLIKIIIQENIMKEAEINLVNKIQDIKKILIIKLIIIRNKDKNNKSHKRSNLKNRITLMIC